MPSTCGNLGCLEAIASGPAVVRRLRGLGADVHDSQEVVVLAKRGDLEAATAVRDAGREIGRVLATCVSLLNPTPAPERTPVSSAPRRWSSSTSSNPSRGLLHG